MMKRIFVCVSNQKSAEETIRFARACCSYVREREMIPIASQYLFHGEDRNNYQIGDLDCCHEWMVDIRICRELMMLSDEVWVFMTCEPDEPMIVVLSLAKELEVTVHIFRKDTLCQLNIT